MKTATAVALDIARAALTKAEQTATRARAELALAIEAPDLDPSDATPDRPANQRLTLSKLLADRAERDQLAARAAFDAAEKFDREARFDVACSHASEAAWLQAIEPEIAQLVELQKTLVEVAEKLEQRAADNNRWHAEAVELAQRLGCAVPGLVTNRHAIDARQVIQNAVRSRGDKRPAVPVHLWIGVEAL